MKQVRREGQEQPGEDVGYKEEKLHPKLSTALALAAADIKLSPGLVKQPTHISPFRRTHKPP